MQNNNPLSETDAEDEFLETPGYVASFGLENTGDFYFLCKTFVKFTYNQVTFMSTASKLRA